ncbi:MAG TPA: hypothetical protein VHD85_12560 [Terracidiphilus sp.]|nr:hypothetical protein [Terracidiphilus sp.]
MRANLLEKTENMQALPTSTAELCHLAASGLVPMLDPKENIFCEIYARKKSGMQRQGLSPRYTLMTLLGLQRYERSGGRSPIDIAMVLETLLRDMSWLTNTGDLGLLLWTCAELVPDRMPQIYHNVSATEALTKFSDGRQGATMEVAWYLTGLAMCYLCGSADLPGLAEQVAAARRILEGNCGDSGIYGHLSRSTPARNYIQRRIGTFADQVYPTIAFARLSQALNDDSACAMAMRTARTICGLQAPLGEWSWRYDSSNGKVVSRYPVYSVHQHAMGPMMLFAAAEASGHDFSEAIYKGLAWIRGNNELHRDFVEPSLGLIWRCIYLDPLDVCIDAALRVVQLRSGTATRQTKVRYECRPYELGWLLYAFAGK